MYDIYAFQTKYMFSKQNTCFPNKIHAFQTKCMPCKQIHALHTKYMPCKQNTCLTNRIYAFQTNTCLTNKIHALQTNTCLSNRVYAFQTNTCLANKIHALQAKYMPYKKQNAPQVNKAHPDLLSTVKEEFSNRLPNCELRTTIESNNGWLATVRSWYGVCQTSGTFYSEK